jgi:hypothetical protein
MLSVIPSQESKRAETRLIASVQESRVKSQEFTSLVQYYINSCRKFITKTLRHSAFTSALLCVKKRARSYAKLYLVLFCVKP